MQLFSCLTLAGLLLITLHATAVDLGAIAMLAYSQKPARLQDRFECVFQNTVTFGASITHETMVKPPVSLVSNAFFGVQGKMFGESPAKVLTLNSGGRVLADYSAAFGHPVGALQINQIMMDPRVENATAVVGIDAFYWDAAWDYCGDTERRIVSLTRLMAAKKTPLILGTVPQDQPELVFWNHLGSLREYAWTPPQPACLKSINDTLKTHCQVENLCYLLDIHHIAEGLNAGGEVRLDSGKSANLQGMRPDGVHISPFGSQYIVEAILKELEKGPKLCR